MFDIQIAVLSDIHGNRWALEAVLADIQRRDIKQIVNLGDCLYGPLDPVGTAQILIDLNIPTVLGNEDSIIYDMKIDTDNHPTLRYVRANLNPAHLQWLTSLPLSTVVDHFFFLCHGTPERNDEYLLSKVTETGVVLRSEHELSSKLSMIAQPVVLCGHDHIPQTVYLQTGKLIVNPGSVGLPAYTDNVPYLHTMQNGSPHARYTILSKIAAGWLIDDIAVPYETETAISAAMDNRRLDWAEWLRTGRATI